MAQRGFLGGDELLGQLAALGGERWFVGETSGLRVLQPGKATGVLYGGCITLLVASLGTPYAPRTEGKLLFLEDRDVKPYQLDRLLRQMVLAGKFEGVNGIIFGEMLDCIAPGQKPGLLARRRAMIHARVKSQRKETP